MAAKMEEVVSSYLVVMRGIGVKGIEKSEIGSAIRESEETVLCGCSSGNVKEKNEVLMWAKSGILVL